jgi:beta propeller repeat protein
MYNISTSRETQITTNEYDQCDPSIYGDRIVWYDFRDGHEEAQSCIFMYNISTFKETQVSDFGHRYRDPSIYGDKIVYYNAEVHDLISLYDLSTHKKTQITDYGSEKSAVSPAIYKDRIVWQDSRNGNEDIYMHNLSTKKEIQITTNKSYQGEPAIYGNRIVWHDDRNGYLNDDIYMCTVSGEGPAPNPPVADFSASPRSGKAPLKVKFTSTGTGSPTSWKWNFGDGSPLSTEKNPEHVYSTAGIYTVKHTAINAYGRDTEIKTNYISVKSPLKAPVAAFSASPRSGKAPLKVQFTDKSTGTPTSWKWSFGDGTYSTAKSPAHKYNKAGKYTVSLTVKNAKGSNTVKKTGYITVRSK